MKEQAFIVVLKEEICNILCVSLWYYTLVAMLWLPLFPRDRLSVKLCGWPHVVSFLRFEGLIFLQVALLYLSLQP